MYTCIHVFIHQCIYSIVIKNIIILIKKILGVIDLNELIEMLFYLCHSPPECIVDFKLVELLILERFQLYSTPGVLQNDSEEFKHCDRISHLFMCLTAIKHPHFKDSFLKGEVKLFKEKLKVEKQSKIRMELSQTLQYLRNLSQREEYRMLNVEFAEKFHFILNVTEAMLSKGRHTFSRLHLKSCRKYKLILPFRFLLGLVARREVEVKDGKVCLSCGRWNEILEVIFVFLLHLELTLLENCGDLRRKIFESEDDRVRQIIRRFQNIVSGASNENRSVIRADEIDKKSLYFPPCMANLHQILRRTHRLSYNSRYQYSLFLRDIGVSVDESIVFWKSEYTKPPENSNCTHDWEKNERRYTYQIEHLYGVIGNHERKTSHSCEKFIEDLQGRMDGGCPFQHLTRQELEKALPKSVQALPDVEDIFTNKNDGFPQKACAVYLNCLQKVLMKNRRNIFADSVNLNKCFYIVSPLQFFNIAKNL